MRQVITVSSSSVFLAMLVNPVTRVSDVVRGRLNLINYKSINYQACLAQCALLAHLFMFITVVTAMTPVDLHFPPVVRESRVSN